MITASRRFVLGIVASTVAWPLVTAIRVDAQAVNAPLNAPRGLAVHGYDVVAYFTDGRPVRGTTAFVHRWRDAEWRFASAAHRDAFAADPERYAPQYGGFCAYGVAEGAQVDVDPTAWRIVDGKLYLNIDHSVQRRWQQDIPGYIRRANENWSRMNTR